MGANQNTPECEENPADPFVKTKFWFHACGAMSQIWQYLAQNMRFLVILCHVGVKSKTMHTIDWLSNPIILVFMGFV